MSAARARHAKAIPKAAGELRSLLKEHHAVLGAELEGKAHAALGQAGELEGWQRWRADQLREEMVAKAQALNTAAQPLGGRKLQEALRHLREQWKQLDLGGPPNHVLWKRFDEACTTAYARGEAWLETIKAEEGAAKDKRQALIDELRAWTAAHAQVADAKAELRELHAFAERWRDAGHLGERAFEPLHAQWKLAVKAAHAPIDGMQQASIERRKALIAQAVGIAVEPFLRIDAVRQLQQRWQQEAQAHPVDRKLEQKLWEQFRGPIDEAFNKKSAEREKAAAEVSERDRAVLDATKALDAAVASGDASKIRAAMADLEQVHRTGAAKSAPAPVVAATIPQAAKNQENTPNVQNPPQSDATDNVASDSTVAVAGPTPADAQPSADSAPAEPQAESPEVAADAATEAVAPAVPAARAKPAPKPVVAMRGDDRPGGKRAEPAAPPGRGRPDARGPGRPGAPGRDARPGLGRPGAPSGAPGAARPAFDRGSDRSTDRGTDRRGPPAGRDFADTREPRDMAPRLGDVAFHAQRDALERAQLQLKKLAGIAHGEAISGLMDAWTQRNGDLMPSAASLGKGVSAGARTAWVQAVSAPAQAKTPAEAILRLEMAAEVPTPAAHINERRVLQLQLLTRRNDPAPVATWAIDARAILSGPFDEGQARRLQAALKVLMR